MAIFELTNTNKYKGVLFADFDNKEMSEKGFFPIPSSFHVGFMALIWTDEEGNWHMKGRIKFPSSNKEILQKSYGKECNETKILADFYTLPLINKIWIKNPDETPEGILAIMEQLDMVEYIKKVIY